MAVLFSCFLASLVLKKKTSENRNDLIPPWDLVVFRHCSGQAGTSKWLQRHDNSIVVAIGTLSAQ